MIEKMEENNKCIIITAPSGAGKTTVVRHLLQTYPDRLGFSVSATNRNRRVGEVDGREYYFFSTEEFEAGIYRGDFVEYEEVYPGRFYGTLHSEVERLWNENKVIVFDIDVQGAIKIRQNLEAEFMAVFIKPPSETVLIDRLRGRQTESESDLRMRIAKVRNELSFQNRFDQIIVNDVLAVTLKEAELMVEEFLHLKKE